MFVCHSWVVFVSSANFVLRFGKTELLVWIFVWSVGVFVFRWTNNSTLGFPNSVYIWKCGRRLRHRRCGSMKLRRGQASVNSTTTEWKMVLFESVRPCFCKSTIFLFLWQFPKSSTRFSVLYYHREGTSSELFVNMFSNMLQNIIMIRAVVGLYVPILMPFFSLCECLRKGSLSSLWNFYRICEKEVFNG